MLFVGGRTVVLPTSTGDVMTGGNRELAGVLCQLLSKLGLM